ncbi:hypothetical protein ALC60_12379 [Trachymyrmex zeteki]|nr:hypothetical protein ALC60_12379 [Trachymyrmex zeteki]
MLNTLARGALGGAIQPGTVSLTNLLDEDSINRIAESSGAKLWAGFITFGFASAGILAVFIIIRVIKLIIDTLIHGYALHSVYGWSMHLIGAVWSFVTHLLLHLGRSPQDEPANNEDKSSPAPLAHLEILSVQHEISDKERNELNDPRAKASHYTYNELRKYLNDSKDPSAPV